MAGAPRLRVGAPAHKDTVPERIGDQIVGRKRFCVRDSGALKERTFVPVPIDRGNTHEVSAPFMEIPHDEGSVRREK